MYKRQLSTNNENPQQASRPFDKDRDGFVIGEGGGALIIETEENAKKRGAKIYAELAGFSNCTDGYHVTSPHPEGIGAVFCMEKAIEHAGITKESVDVYKRQGDDRQYAGAFRNTFVSGCVLLQFFLGE